MAVSKSFSRLAQVLAAHGERSALRFAGEAISFAQLHERAQAAAGVAWHAWNVRPGDRVAWLGHNDPALLALLFGLGEIGAILQPLNTRLAAAEWEAQLRAAGARHLVHDAAFADAAQSLGERLDLQVHAPDALDATSPAPPALAIAGDAPVLLVNTSGTTGGPKAAVHTHANLLANMAIATQVQQLTPDDRVLTVLPLFHVGGLCIQTLPALFAGAEVLLHPRFTPDATLAAIAHDRPTLTLQVPATMKALVDHPQWASTELASLRAVWAGSSILPRPLIEAFHARGVPVCNVYGATETGPFSIALPSAQAFGHAGACGWPAPGVDVRFGERHGDAAELLVRGPNVVARYWPDTPATDPDGWFATGDLATRAADGSYTVVGRARELIISGGENVHPAEIEQWLAAHPAVLECAAFGQPDAQWGEVVAAAVVLRPGCHASDAELRDHLAPHLARFKLPRRWYRVAQLPKTALGKLQRAALAQSVVG